MKVAINLVVDVDPVKWLEVYPTAAKRCDDIAAIRKDIKEYVLTDIQGSTGIEDSRARVTLKNP